MNTVKFNIDHIEKVINDCHVSGSHKVEIVQVEDVFVFNIGGMVCSINQNLKVTSIKDGYSQAMSLINNSIQENMRKAYLESLKK